MNKQEFIERIKSLKNIFGNKCEYIKIDAVIELASELDEPQKVAVPQFVSEYIEFKKTYDFHVYGAMREIEDHYDKRVPEWFYENNIETFVRAWLDGYEVEKEKRYLVKMKNLRALFCYLAYIPDEGYWTLMASGGESIVIKHTRKQLEEAGFGWVFDCPGIEIEEVKDDSKV